MLFPTNSRWIQAVKLIRFSVGGVTSVSLCTIEPDHTDFVLAVGITLHLAYEYSNSKSWEIDSAEF